MWKTELLELCRSRLAALEEVRTLRERVTELGALCSQDTHQFLAALWS